MAGNRKHKRQQRSPSGKTQKARTLANEQRRANRRKEQQKKAASGHARWKPEATITGGGKDRKDRPIWVSDKDSFTFRKKSQLISHLRLTGIPDRRIVLAS